MTNLQLVEKPGRGYLVTVGWEQSNHRLNLAVGRTPDLDLSALNL